MWWSLWTLFQEFKKNRMVIEENKKKEEIIRQGGTEDDRRTWTVKRVRPDGTVEKTEAGGVGKYLKAATERGSSGTGGKVPAHG